MISKTGWTDAYKTAWNDAVEGKRRFLTNVAFYDSDGNETTTADDSSITELTVTQNLYDSPGIGFCSSAQMDMRVIPRMDASGDPILPEAGCFVILNIRPEGTAASNATRMGRFIVRACSYDVYTALATITATDSITAFGDNMVAMPSDGAYAMNEYLGTIARLMKSAFGAYNYIPSTYTHWHSDLLKNMTCREALSLIATFCGCNCIVGKESFLTFVLINENRAISGTTSYPPVDIGKSAERITLGASATINPYLHAAKNPAESSSVTVDEDDYYISVSERYPDEHVFHATTYNPGDAYARIVNQCLGDDYIARRYTPFTAERILMDPCVEIGDAVTIPYGSIPAWKGGSGTGSVTGQLSRIVTDYRTPQFSDIECAFPR